MKIIQVKKILLTCIVFMNSFTWSFTPKSILLESLQRLQQAYPDYIKSYDEHDVIWFDGTKMPIQDGKPNKTAQEKLDSPSLADQLNQPAYLVGVPKHPSSFHPINDPGRIRYEPFFRKMYGNNASSVNNKLTVIYWMPNIFGKHYPLSITTVNSVDKKLLQVSAELESLVRIHPEFIKYLENPGGTFNWRVIAHTKRLSPHSFGMTIDINYKYSNYWQWDLQKQGRSVSENAVLSYHNQIPWDIVEVFEKHGFIWGGKWYHYDTMHFEYRPELMRR